MEHAYFFIALSFILVHEMDAIQQKEWRIFPGLSLLNDKVGYYVFTALHIPLFALIWYGLKVNYEGVVYGLNIFFIVHVGLHLLFLMHKKNQFTGFFSWFIIVGAGLFAGLDLLLSN